MSKIVSDEHPASPPSGIPGLTGPTGPISPGRAEPREPSSQNESPGPPSGGALNRIATMAAKLCGTPIATVSIVDRDRVWCAATEGLDTVPQVGAEPGLCASVVLGSGPYVVNDAQNDARTMDHPLVRGDHGLRFYAAVPILSSDGHPLGTVSVIDRRPGTISAEQLSLLADLAGIVSELLEGKLAAVRAVRAVRAERASQIEDAGGPDAGDQPSERISEASGAEHAQPRPDRCQLGGTRQCQQPADLKVADSWGDSAWGCWEHAEDALRQVPSVYLAQDTPNGLQAYRARTTPAIMD